MCGIDKAVDKECCDNCAHSKGRLPWPNGDRVRCDDPRSVGFPHWSWKCSHIEDGKSVSHYIRMDTQEAHRHPEDDRLRRGEAAAIKMLVSIVDKHQQRIERLELRAALAEQRVAALLAYIGETGRKPEYPCGYDERPEDCGGMCAPRACGGDCPVMRAGLGEKNGLLRSQCDAIAADAKAYEKLQQAFR